MDSSKLKFQSLGGHIREINAQSSEEIELVAQRMRQTLVEVVGQQRGESLYSMEWLRERVRWHLDGQKTTAKIFLAEFLPSSIVGHAIARLEKSETGEIYGYFSTLFVAPEHRQQGVATALMNQVESWFLHHKMPKIIYNTATTNERLLRLFRNQGYAVTHEESEMVQLTKDLSKGN